MILCLFNSFKGSFSSKELNTSVYRFLSKKRLKVKYFNISDGGDGFVDCFEKKGKVIEKIVTGPFYTMNVKASYVIDGENAYIEIARACGIRYLKPDELDIMRATTYGVGQLIIDAVKKGAKNIYLGLGGTASNDCGVGMAKAIGVKFYDENNKEIDGSIYEILRLKKIDFANIKIEGVNFYGVCDVENKLLGKNGSARVFGKQKGANKEQIRVIEKALKNLTDIIKKEKRVDISKIEGGAAAGGLGAGLYGFLDAKLLKGSRFIMEGFNIYSEIKKSEIIITGEGRVDKSSFYGKITGEIINFSIKNNKRVVLFTVFNEFLKKTKNLEIIELSKKYDIPYLRKNLDNAIIEEVSKVVF